MMILTIHNQCTLTGAGPETAAAIMKLLRVKNPDFIKAQRYGRSTWYVKEYLCLAEVTGDTVTFPREARNEVLAMLPPDVQISDCRLKLPPVHFNAPAVGAWDHQATAINVISRVGSGVVEAPCGAGKTNIAHSVVQRIGQPTLWLTHKKDLLEQSMERCIKLLGVTAEDIGTITAGKVRLGGKITFATVQTLANLADADLYDLGGRFGLVIVDECHHVFATPKQVTQFAKCINAFPAYYRIGITATAKRADGLEKTMTWLLGKVVYSIPHGTLYDGGYIIRPKVKRVSTQFEYLQTDIKLDFNDLLSAMTGDAGRNRLILDLITNLAPFSHILVLTARVEHATDLHGWLLETAAAYKPEIVHGGTKMPERERIYAAVRAGSCRVLVATYELAKEGLDMPVLDTLVYATPVKNDTMVEQSCGRIMRACEGKDGATVWDIVDQRVTACRRQWAARKKVYQKLQIEIEEVNRK